MTVTIDEERWSAVDAAPNTAHEVLADAGLVGTVGKLASEAIDIQTQRGGVLDQIFEFERALMLKEHVMHRPERSLSTSGLCGLCGTLSVGMHLREGEMAVRQTQTVTEVTLHGLDDGVRLSAEGALVIPVLDQRDRGRLRPKDMIRRIDWWSERGLLDCDHVDVPFQVVEAAVATT